MDAGALHWMGTMRIRFQLALAIFVTGCLGVTALLQDRADFTRQILYGRAEARALAISESVGGLMLPHLKSAELRPLSQGVRAFAALPSVAYIRITDLEGRILFESSRPGRRGARPPASGVVEDDQIEVRTPIRDPDSRQAYGSVQLAVGTEGLEDSLRALAWRGAAVGILAILALALVALAIGTLLGRKLELLTDAVERLKNSDARAPGFVNGNSEVDRLASAFSALHRRVLDEEDRLKGLEAFKTELMSMLVHDMKHPVAVLGAAVGALERGDWALASERRKETILGMAKQAIGRENAMIEDLLQLARLNNPEMPLQRRRLALGDFLEGCAAENALVAEQAGRPWRAELEAGVSSRWIYGDKSSLRRLIGNLVLNAVEHTPPGAQITLGARLRDDGSKVEIFVSDEGSGIPMEKREAIFRAYRGAGESSLNLGVGLAYCRIVAEKHAGRLEVKSALGKGSFFALVLPASQHESREAQEAVR